MGAGFEILPLFEMILNLFTMGSFFAFWYYLFRAFGGQTKKTFEGPIEKAGELPGALKEVWDRAKDRGEKADNYEDLAAKLSAFLATSGQDTLLDLQGIKSLLEELKRLDEA